MNALLMAALTYSAALILMTQGFVLTYKTTRAPNFMLGYLMIVGVYAASTSKDLMGLPLYMSYLTSFIVGAILMVVISLAIIEPLLRKKTSPVLIALTTMGLGIVLEGIVQIYDEYINQTFGLYRIMLKMYDFNLAGIPGVFITATILTLASLLFFRYVETRTRIGLELRASLENTDLAQIQGINTNRNRVLLWVLAGGMSSLAGGIMVMWFNMGSTSGSWISTTILAAAILGGMNSVRGAFIGGLAIGVLEIMLTTWLQAYIGVWIGEYRAIIPFTVLCLTLLLAPNGLMGSDIEEHKTRASFLRRVRRKTLAAVLIWFALSGALFVNVSNTNKAKAREAVIEELSCYDLEVMEINRSIPRFDVGNLTTFKGMLDRLNITKIYKEPGKLTFYYFRHNAYWMIRVQLRRYGLWEYRAV